MGKEQELRSCPFCGGAATLQRVPETMIADCTDAVVRCSNCDALGPPVLYERETGQDDPHPEAIAAWNRRSSSDEQRAEVVAAYDKGRELGAMALEEIGKMLVDAAAEVRSDKPFASPAVAAGGVTEEMVRAAEAVANLPTPILKGEGE